MKISMTKNAIGIVREDGSQTASFLLGKEYVSEGKWQEDIFKGFVSMGQANEIGGNAPVPETKRARNDDGTLMGDDASTPNINEAWVGGKAPIKKSK